MNYAGLLYDDSVHYVDHLAPFCALRGWPLFVCDPDIGELCRHFYPDLEVRETSIFSLKKELPSSIVACESRALLEQTLGSWLPEEIKTFWLPHGHSDKGWDTPFFEALKRDDLLFVYGERMRHVLRSKAVSCPQESVGNFRLRYYQKHRSFYEEQLQKRFGSARFVLYAPTWDTRGTFWNSFESLARHIPHLAVKLHPNTERTDDIKLEQCKARHSNIRFIEDFPCIYPLLSRSDAYIGDMSSIGYDMLAFNKPLIFLTHNPLTPSDPSAFLMQCGEQILPNEIDQIPSFLVRDQKKEKRAALFSHVFDGVA